MVIEEGSAGEIESHAHHLGAVGIDVDRPDHPRVPILLRPDLYLDEADGVRPGANANAVGDREVVEPQPGGRERVRNVAHLVPFANANEVGKVVWTIPRWSRWYWISVGYSVVSRRPIMRCLLRLGAFQ